MPAPLFPCLCEAQQLHAVAHNSGPEASARLLTEEHSRLGLKVPHVTQKTLGFRL